MKGQDRGESTGFPLHSWSACAVLYEYMNRPERAAVLFGVAASREMVYAANAANGPIATVAAVSDINRRMALPFI